MVPAESLDALQHVAELLAGPGGTFFLIVLLGTALVFKKLVLGWVYDDCIQDGIVCRKDLSERIAKGESELEKLRQERMGHRD